MIFRSTSLPQSKNVCVCVCVCLCPSVADRRDNQSTDLVQIRYLGSPCKYLELFFFLVFPLPLKLKVVHMRKKFKYLIFSKIAPAILIKFCGFIVHSKPKNMALTVFPGKILDTRKIVFKYSVCHVT